jgi:hypothetical protein
MSPCGMYRLEPRRGNYCPHCRTTEHDGSTCPLYQAYQAGCERQNCAEMMEFGAGRQQLRYYEDENADGFNRGRGEEMNMLSLESDEEENKNEEFMTRSTS